VLKYNNLMSKKTIYIVIAAFVAIILIILGISLLTKPSAPAGKELKPREFTPFPRPEEKPAELPVSPLPPPAEEKAPAVVAPAKPTRFVKIADFPVTGYGLFEVAKTKEGETVEIFDFSNCKKVKLDSESDCARNIKTLLNRFAAKEKLNLTDPKKILIEFQKKFGLKADGAVGKKTLAALNDFQNQDVSFVPVIRYIAHNNSHIYERVFDDLEKVKKLSNTTIPDLGEAFLGQRGSWAILRYAEKDENSPTGFTIQSFSGKITEPPSPEVVGTVDGDFLPANIIALTLSPDKTKMFYLIKENENVLGFVSSLDNKNKEQVFSFPFGEWLVDWPNEKNIVLNTKPSAAVAGFLFFLNPKEKKISNILAGISGLTSLGSPDGKFVLFSQSINKALKLSFYDIDKNEAKSANLKTLAEKCVFNEGGTTIYCAVPKTIPEADYPDEWYQGIVSFADEIWKIDVATLKTTKIADPAEEIGEEVDATNLAVDSGEKNLVFINKRDGSLWLLKL